MELDGADTEMSPCLPPSLVWRYSVWLYDCWTSPLSSSLNARWYEVILLSAHTPAGHLSVVLTWILVKSAKAAERYKLRLFLSRRRNSRKKKMSECHWAKCHINSAETDPGMTAAVPRGAAIGVLKLSHGIMHILLGNSLYEGQLRGAFRQRCAISCYA